MATRRQVPRSLKTYRAKRDFWRTREPAGGDEPIAERRFVIQKHAARRLHYDLRLQFGDTLKSWAVPHGPSLDPKVRRLAVHVEDHPLEYVDFEGPIPAGQYGAGGMIVWDRGTWVPMGDADADYRKGTLKFRLAGEKLGGGWMLVRLKNDSQRGDNWLLIKERDPFARSDTESDILDERPESVISGRTVEDIEPVKPTESKPLRLDRLKGAKRAPLPPGAVPPQLATPATQPPAGRPWLHEIKFDGYRTLARIDADDIRLFTRAGHDWTDRYGDLTQAFTVLPCRQALIDGEIVVQDEHGHSSFSALQDALADGETSRLVFFAFDLLFLDGFDLTDVGLLQRKRVLKRLAASVVGTTSALQLSDHVQGEGPAFFERAEKLGLEGVISKRADAPYRSGRSKSWIKTKCILGDEFVVVGFTASDAAGGLGALLVAQASPQGLRYAGRVGTGFTQAEMRQLRKRLHPLRVERAPVDLPPDDRRKDIIWVRPALLIEVRYGSRTADGILRFAAYQGLRTDKVVDADPPPTPTPRKRYVTDADLASIWVTNPDRVMFGKGGPTKLDLALYYARVGDWLLPEIAGRPISVVRCPSGKIEDCFFQRHALAGMPDAVKQLALRQPGAKERADYLYISDAKGLLALAQFGVVEFHPWGCRIDKPERPDRLVFDLDPDESLPWREVVAAAQDVRAALEALGLVTFVKTTGGKGLHVVVPIVRRSSWSEAFAFCETFVGNMAAKAPTRFTGKLAKRRRRGRILIDYLRNVRGATAVGAYALRARPGVPAATPVSWQELEKIDDPRDFNYATVPARLNETFVDPWVDLDRSARALTKEIERKLKICD